MPKIAFGKSISQPTAGKPLRNAAPSVTEPPKTALKPGPPRPRPASKKVPEEGSGKRLSPPSEALKDVQPEISQPLGPIKPIPAPKKQEAAPVKPAKAFVTSPKGKPSAKSARPEDSYDRAVERLADAADREAVRAKDLIRFPELLVSWKIDPATVSHGMANDADKLNRQRTNDLLAKYK